MSPSGLPSCVVKVKLTTFMVSCYRGIVSELPWRQTACSGFKSELHAEIPRAAGILVVPKFLLNQLSDSKHKPTASETFDELRDAINFVRKPQHYLVAVFFFFHLTAGIIFAIHLLWFVTPASLIFLILSTFFLGTLYNTMWYHRYCSHGAFKFYDHWPKALFLWTNPLLFREESYAIPHKVHHHITDHFGDPYGPHLGWLASFLSSELTQRINTDIPEQEFNRLKRSIRHIGLAENSYEAFRQTGSIERIREYAARNAVAQAFWGGLVFSVGGITLITAWYGAIFVILFLIRDFNWRGHGGSNHRPKKQGWEFDDRSRALNQYFYGFLASEWHDNHHRYPLSANNAFLNGQIDVAFQIIRFLKLIGIVESYVDVRPTFERQCLGPASRI
jgi:sn-1 stearoyl-lipid 9-desaturase